MTKTRQKISGGFRAASGAERFAIVRSVVSTARKRAWDILQTLAAQPPELTGKLRPS